MTTITRNNFWNLNLKHFRSINLLSVFHPDDELYFMHQHHGKGRVVAVSVDTITVKYQHKICYHCHDFLKHPKWLEKVGVSHTVLEQYVKTMKEGRPDELKKVSCMRSALEITRSAEVGYKKKELEFEAH